MRYAKIDKCDIANGKGCGVTLFVQGCLPNKCKEGHCPGCFNSDAWDFTKGKEYTTDTTVEILNYLDKSYINHLSLLGGEIFDQGQDLLIDLCELVNKQYPEKLIWCWTGYEFDQIKSKELCKYIDVIITGPFIFNKKDITSNNIYRGSTNQRVIMCKDSLESNKIIYMPDIPNNNV